MASSIIGVKMTMAFYCEPLAAEIKHEYRYGLRATPIVELANSTMRSLSGWLTTAGDSLRSGRSISKPTPTLLDASGIKDTQNNFSCIGSVLKFESIRWLQYQIKQLIATNLGIVLA